MASQPRPWTVLRNDPIQKLAPNLWNIDGDIPGMPLRRRMVLHRLGDGRVVVHNAVALDPAGMAELEAWGEPAFLVVPNGWHRLDAHAWAERYPRIQVLCPPEASRRVAQQVRVDGDYGLLPQGADLGVTRIAGGKAGEAVFLSRHDGQTSAVFGDMLMNLPHGKGFWWTTYRLTGSTGGPRVTGVMKLFGVADKTAVARHYGELAGLPGLSRVVPGHGIILDGAEAAEALRTAASRLHRPSPA